MPPTTSTKLGRGPLLLGLFTLLLLGLFYTSLQYVETNVSPQGCRMSWMHPSSILMEDFDTKWTRLGGRYTLWLYREKHGDGVWDVGLDQIGNGVPVIFVPGNAGSFKQVRSIASSAARQYYVQPGRVSPEFAHHKPLDFYAVDYNEDLSAFHGPTLEAQIEYTSRAVSYVLSLYPPNTKLILMGHSMGGIVTQAMLAQYDPNSNYTVSDHVSAVFTMSTPHRLPPARFDQRIERVYAMAQRGRETGVPVLSICGGVADGMIPSESCAFPANDDEGEGKVIVKTVFTSGMEGAWTGVGHREMVWCHQIRWRIARASLEIGAHLNPPMEVLNRWFRDGSGRKVPRITSPPLHLQEGTYTILPDDVHLTLKQPKGSGIPLYLLPVPISSTSPSKRFIFYLSQGSISGIAPHLHTSLQATVYRCHDLTSCEALQPDTLKLIPNPIDGMPFPAPMSGRDGGGVDESEGVVVFEADVDADGERGGYVGLKLEGADGRGWALGGFLGEGEGKRREVGMLDLLFGGVILKGMQHTSLKVTYHLPRLLHHVFLVYRLNSLLHPLIEHTSQPFETHYFPLRSSRSILLHTHANAPYVSALSKAHGLQFSIYSDACQFDELKLSIDWTASLGRMPPRYAMTLLSWTVGIVSLVLFGAWGGDGTIGPIQTSIANFCGRPLRMLVLVSVLLALVPWLPHWAYLGNAGEVVLAPIAPLLVVIASGLMVLSWGVLDVLVWGLSKILPRRSAAHGSSTSKSSVLSMLAIFLIVFLFVPWQVAYLCCWVIHLYTCATTRTPSGTSAGVGAGAEAVPLVSMHDPDGIPAGPSDNDEIPNPDPTSTTSSASSQPTHLETQTAYNYNTHILLWMTWLLPLAAPVLVVWARTLLTAGLTTPFDGDHFFLNVAPFAVLVEFAGSGRPLGRHRLSSGRHGLRGRWMGLGRWISVRWGFAVLASVAFVLGPRWTYLVFDVARVVVGVWVGVVWVGRTV